MTIQEMSTSLSQQVELTTLSQITGLESRSSTVMSKSMPVFANDYTTTSYFYTTSPSLETMTAPKLFKTSMVETATLAAEVLSASAYFTLPTQSTSTGKTTNSIKITIVLPSESASTTKMTGAMDTETFYPTMATNFPTTSGFIKNSIMSQTLAIESQSAIMRPTSLSSTIESISTSTTSWPKHRTIDIGALSTAGREFLASAAAGDTSWSIVEQTSSTTAHIGTASTFPSESVLISTVALGDSVFPRNQTASTLATADTKIAFSVHLVTLPTRPSQITPSLRTTKPESTTVNVQGISSPTVEGAMSNSMSEKISFMALSFVTPSTFTGTQSSQPGINSEPTHIALSHGIPFTPTMAETILSPTSTRPIHTQNTITGGEHMITLISSRSVSTSKASESNLTSITDEYAHLFSTNETTWTAKPDKKSMKTTNLLTFVPSENFTSASHGSTTNTEHSSTATKIITPPEASTEGVATSTTDATTGKYTVALSKLTSQWFANFSTVPGTPSVTNTPEFKLTTLPLKSSFMSTVVANELSLITKGTIVPPVGIISTLANVKPNFSTKDSPSETTQTETNGTSTFGDTTVPVPKSATTRRLNATMTKEIISPYLKGKSTISAITEVSPFSTMLEATDESAQMITASVSVFPFPVIEKLTTPSGNKPATIEVKESWLSTKLMNSTPKNSYNATTEIFNSIHIYSTPWTSETPEGNSNPSLNPGNTQTFPEALGASTTRIFGISFTTTPIDKSAMSLSASILLPWSSATLPSATLRPVSHMSSLPVNVSAVTSMMVSDKMKVTMPEPSTLARPLSISVLSDVLTLSSATKTKALVPPLAQTASTPNDTLPTHSDSIHTTTMTSARLTLIEVPSLAENPVPSLRTPTPVTTKAETTLLSTSAAIVTPSTYFAVCSKLPPDNISSVSSTPVTSTKSELVVTQSISLAEETSTYEPSFPYSLSASENVVSLTTGITETSAIDRIKPLPTSAHKPATSIDIHTSQSSTHQVDAQVSTQLETGPSTLSSDEEQMITSPGKTPRTMEVTEMSPSTNCFIFYSQGISTLEMSDAGFSETPQISSHQTHSSSEIPLGTPPNGDSVSSSIPGSPQTIPILTSSNTVDVHLSEMYTSHRKTALPSQDLTTITLLHHEKESARALSTHTPRTMETVVSSTPVTQPISFHLDTSFVDTTTSRTTRISNSVNINTILSHFLSLRTQPGMISVAPSISESTHTFPKPLSPSTTRVSNANFTVITTDGTSSALSIPNVPTTLLGKASKTTFNPIYQMSSLPVNITFLTSKQVSRTTDMLMTKSSKTTHTGCLKSSSIDTSGPMSEMPSVSVNDSTFSSTTVSSDTSSSAGSSSILLSSITPSTTMTIQTSALDVTPLAYAGPTSKSTMTSSAFTASETTEVSSRITAEFLSFSTEPNFPSVKTIPMSTMTEIVTPFVDITASSLLSYKNTEAISSIPKTKFSPLQSTTQQSSPTDEAATAGMLPGIANSSLSTLSNGRITAQRSTYSTMAVLESVLSPTPSDNLHTSLNFQVSPPSPSLTSFKNTPGPTKNIKGATYTTGKMNSLLENTFTAELPKSATSVNIPVSYPPWIPSSATPTSWASFSYSPHSTETEFSITNTFPLLTSEMVELPLLGIIITSNNTQSLPMTLWNTLTTKDFQFPVSTTTYAPTTNKVETEPLSLTSGSLSTFTASQMDPVFRDVRTVPSILTLEIFPTFGLSGSPSLSTSSRTNPTTLADIKNTFEKTITSGTPRTTFSSSSSDATSRSIITKVTTPVLTCILPSFPSGPPLKTVSNAPHVINSTTVEGSKSTFRTSDMIPAHPFANFTTLPFVTKSILLSKTTPTHTMDDITTSVPIFLPMSTKVTDDSVCISTSPEALPRTTVSADHRTLSQSPFFSTMRISPSTTDYPLSFGSMHLPSPTITSAWSRIPAASASRTSIFSKPTPDSPINVTTAIFAATGSSFPLISTGETHNSILTVSPLVSSSFETTWMDSTLSSPSTEALTSLIGTKCTGTVPLCNASLTKCILWCLQSGQLSENNKKMKVVLIFPDKGTLSKHRILWSSFLSLLY